MNRTQGRDSVGCGPEDAASVGEVLRARRVARGLTVDEVAGAIKFSARHVLAVELGRFDALPPPPYGRGLISAYADLVGVEPEALLQSCARALAAARDGRRARIFRLPIRERLTWRDWTVPLGLAAAFVAIVVARAAMGPDRVELPEPRPVQRPVQRPVPRPDADGRADAPKGTEVVPAEPEPAPPVASPPAGVPPTAAQAQPAPLAVPGVRVVLRCEGTTWAEAAADGGEARRYELGPGQVLELVARERLSLSLGDAGVVRVRVGERDLGFIGDKGETRTGMSFVAQKPVAPPAHAPAGD